VLISLYSGRSCWVMVPTSQSPPLSAITRCGTLIYEGTMPSALISDDLWTLWRGAIQKQGFCQVNEDLGLLLLTESGMTYGTLRMEAANDSRNG